MMHYAWRRPVPADLNIVLALINASEITEYDDPDTDEAELSAQWGRVKLGRSAWLACADDGRLAGYCLAEPGSDIFTIEFYVDPNHPDNALRRTLLERSLRDIRTTVSGQGGSAATVRSYSANHVREDAAALTAFGFQRVRYHLRMQIDMVEAPGVPVWPNGVEMRPMHSEAGEAIYALMKSAFAEHGEDWSAFQPWRDFMMRSDHFTPSFWFLLWHEDVLIGAALCVDYPQHGWVRQLGVSPGWRRRGLAGKLLRHAFRAFFEQGQRRVGLGVRATNEKALALYEKAGMQRARQYDEYQLVLSFADANRKD